MTDNIRVLTHSSIRIATDAGVIYVDPFHVKDTPQDAAFVFVTHDHFDHFSPEDIAKVSGPETVLVVPEKMKKKAENETAGSLTVVTVKPGETYRIGDLAFETVPAYNKIKPFHPRSAGWVGYVFSTDGKRIYVAGDTDATREAGQVSCDVALVPVGGTYTMNPAQAAGLVNAIRPSAAIPTHYGSVVGSKGDAEQFAGQVDPEITVRIIMEE